MRKYNIPPAFSGSLQLGRQGENGVTEITFLCAGYAKMYGDGFAEAVHRTPDGTTYPVNIEQDENNRVSWLISDGDTATAGTGQLELRWMVNGNLAKSKIFSTIIKSALTAPETPPDAAKSWVDKVLKAAEDIKLSGITEQKAREIAKSVVDAYQEKDPTVPDWAKAETKPTYTAAEVGAVPESAKSDIDKNTSARHTHGNKSALDAITAQDIAKWNSGTAGTVEITGAKGLVAGSAPTVTETADSTAQARKYTLGIPAGAKGEKGENGTGGKSAYQFAQEAGYAGTETDFSKKLNQTTFANPFPLTFTGAISAAYDGSSAVTVDLPFKKNKLYGKSLFVAGDSVAYGYGSNNISFGEIIAKNNNMRLTKVAISGTTFAKRDGLTNSILEQVESIDKEYDYIIVEGGFNDYFQRNNGVSIGTMPKNMNSGRDDKTTYGALDSICLWLKQNYPASKILFVVPHKIMTAKGVIDSEFYSYLQAIRNVSEKYSIRYADIALKGGCTPFYQSFRDKYFSGDGIHPNLSGYETFYVPIIESEMEMM